MIKWKRPSGSFIDTVETSAIIKYAENNGWVQAEKVVEKPAEAKKKAKKVKKVKKVKNDNSTTNN